jgi:RNA polymerase primary sigma factor/RNA polymerase sigma factor
MDFKIVFSKLTDSKFKIWEVPEFENTDTSEILSEMPDFDKWEKKRINIKNIDLSNIPTFLHNYYQNPILNKNQEYHLFRKMHFYRYKAMKLAKEATNDSIKNQSVYYYEQNIEIRNIIVSCNVRLTTTVIKKRKDIYGSDLTNLISDGFLNIIKGTEAFDYRRGIKFSTYCTWVLLNNSIREQIPNVKHQTFFSQYDEETTEGCEDNKDRNIIEHMEIQEAGKANWEIIQKHFSATCSKEMQIIRESFGLGCEKKEVDTIAKNMGVTKERVRQLRSKGLKEIRKAFASGKIKLTEI